GIRDFHVTGVQTCALPISWDEFKETFGGEGGAGFVLAHWDGTPETEERIAEETKATIRCIPMVPFVPEDEEPGTCILTGKPSQQIGRAACRERVEIAGRVT